MKKRGKCLLIICTLFLCGYNKETGKGCTHKHNNLCGYQNNQCVHSSHVENNIGPRVNRGGDC